MVPELVKYHIRAASIHCTTLLQVQKASLRAKLIVTWTRLVALVLGCLFEVLMWIVK